MPLVTPESCAKDLNRHGKRATKAISMADEAVAEGCFDLSKDLLGEAISEIQSMMQPLAELQRMKEMGPQRAIEVELDKAEGGKKGFGSRLLGKSRGLLPALPAAKPAPEDINPPDAADDDFEDEYDEEAGEGKRVPKKRGGVR